MASTAAHLKAAPVHQVKLAASQMLLRLQWREGKLPQSRQAAAHPNRQQWRWRTAQRQQRMRWQVVRHHRHRHRHRQQQQKQQEPQRMRQLRLLMQQC